MSTRPPYLDRFYPDVYRGLNKVTRQLREIYPDVDLPLSLIELVSVRVSQINGCAACLSIHVPAARRAGVDEVQLDVLPSWREADVFDERERAALELAETLTLLPSDRARTDPAVAACRIFAEEQVAALEWAIIMINTYNRISIASGHPVARRS